MRKGDKSILQWIGLIILLLWVLACNAQEVGSPLQSVIEQEKWDVLAVPEDIDLRNYQDYEQDLLENPVNLGEINPLELLRLGILDRTETDALYQYLLDYGPMKSVYELQMIEGIPEDKIAELAKYICVNQGTTKIPSLKDLFRHPRMEVLMSGKRIVETKAGYLKDTNIISRANQYEGNPWKEKVSVRTSFGRNLSLGLSASKDAGEKDFLSNSNYSFDKKAVSLTVNNIGIIKRVVVGNYGVSFGQGLTLGCGSGIGLGKESDLRMQSRGLYSSSSTNPLSSLNGAGIWMRSGLIGLCIFYSKDKEAGMHLSAGGEQWNSGISLLYHKTDTLIALIPAPYKYFATKTGNFWVGWDGTAFLRNLILFHELTLSSEGNLAGLMGMTFSPAPLVKTSFMMNVIPGFWNNPNVSTGIISSQGANQFDINANIQLQINRYFELNLTSDNTRYHWLRYATTSPSDKICYHITLTTHPSKASQIDCYYKIISDQVNVESEGKSDSIGQSLRKSWGVLCKYMPDNAFTFKSSIRMVQNKKSLKKTGMGWLITQDISFWPIKKRLKLNGHIAFFDTDTYDERIYSWEADVYRGFSVPAYYYRGYQYAFVMQYHINRWMDAWMKYSVFNYPDRVTLGSSSEMINGNRKSEVSLELRVLIPPGRN